MSNPAPSQIEIAIYRASYDGQYWGRYPHGDKPGPSMFGEAAAGVSASGDLITRPQLQGHPSVSSAAAGVLSGGAAPANTNWRPGIWTFNNLASMQTAAGIIAYMDAVVAQDVNNKVQGFRLSPGLAQLVGPGSTTYPGFAVLDPVTAHAQSYNPPREIILAVNLLGNGYTSASTQNPAFLSGFCPTYLNVGAKGSPTDGFGGGEVHQSSSGVPLDRPYCVIWNTNFVDEYIRVIGVYYQRYSYNNGIHGIDPANEFSVSASAPGYSAANLLNIWSKLCSGLRQAAPRWMIHMKPTFIPGANGANYAPIISAMYDNLISLCCEDFKLPGDDGYRAYQGQWPTTPTNYVANRLWDVHANFDPAEMWFENNSTAALPPAVNGSGLFYANGTTTTVINGKTVATRGVMDNAQQIETSYWYMYTEGYGVNCPNINCRTGNTSRFANPSFVVNGVETCPAPGSHATRPNIMDLINNNQVYANVGIQPNGIFTVRTARPPRY